MFHSGHYKFATIKLWQTKKLMSMQDKNIYLGHVTVIIMPRHMR